MQRQIAALIGFGGLAWIAMATGALAQPQGRPCQPDIEKLCKGVETGGGRIRDCLKNHSKDLSPGCKAMLDSNQGVFAGGRPGAGPRRQGMLQACEADLEKHCKGIQPGGGRLRVCLGQHQAELSDACKKAMPTPGESGKADQKPK